MSSVCSKCVRLYLRSTKAYKRTFLIIAYRVNINKGSNMLLTEAGGSYYSCLNRGAILKEIFLQYVVNRFYTLQNKHVTDASLKWSCHINLETPTSRTIDTLQSRLDPLTALSASQ